MDKNKIVELNGEPIKPDLKNKLIMDDTSILEKVNIRDISFDEYDDDKEKCNERQTL